MPPDDPDNAPPVSLVQFPRWANYLLPACVLAAIGLGTYLPTLAILGLSPSTTNVGYRPTQPVPFDHALHVKALGIDCRYCHSTVQDAAFAALPPTQTCMNCHAAIKTDSPLLEPVRRSFAEGTPIPWKKVHDLPDYAYFNHAAHLAKGVGCASCHGAIDDMPQVFQSQPLSMGWCLDCHRQPELHLRPRDQITNMSWNAESETGRVQRELSLLLKREYNVADDVFMTSCSTCHR
ncbi:MAG: cytochrome c3 family protein [Phycisphaeraceae bacterium]